VAAGAGPARGAPRSGPRAALGALVALCAFAFALRALGFEWVFVGERVLLLVGDPHYQARLALYCFERFPEFLAFDPYINYPDGAAVPGPPLLDLAVAGAARLLGDDLRTFERVLAWSTPVWGAATVPFVYAAARVLAGRGTALGAAALFAALPVATEVARIGNADHHAGVACLGAAYLAVLLALARPGASPLRLAALGAGLALARLALFLGWSGSLLYVGLGDALLLLAAALAGRRNLLLTFALGALATALLVAPLVAALPTPASGAWSAASLSALHVAGELLAAALAALLLALERRRPAARPLGRLARLAGLGILLGAAALAWRPLREGLAPALAFLTTDERMGATVLELQPLYGVGGGPASTAVYYYGLFAFLIPLAPLGPLLAARDPVGRAPALALAGWSAALGGLALWQIRHGVDFAAGASVAFALLLAEGLRVPATRLHLRRATVAAAAVLVGAASLWSPARVLYLPRARGSLAALAGRGPAADEALATPSGTLIRFLEEVRRVTPETSGYFDPEQRPEYALLSSSRLGHSIHYVARRASAADGLLDALDPERFAATQRFFELRGEGRAVALAAKLGARYVVTQHFPDLQPGSLGARLQLGDGLGEPPLSRFRLVTEGPPGGRPLGDLLGLPRPEQVVPYKLFEVVRGAVLEAEGAPGEAVEAELELGTPLGRRLVYRAAGRVGADGLAHLRVPYPSTSSAPVRALGPWRLRVGDAVRPARVDEDDVREGRVVVVGSRSGAGPS
jgi:dolichyl-diphosphooligosaccharide--protein glycosyltransferase